jgi:hypothetical protein
VRGGEVQASRLLSLQEGSSRGAGDLRGARGEDLEGEGDSLGDSLLVPRETLAGKPENRQKTTKVPPSNPPKPSAISTLPLPKTPFSSSKIFALFYHQKFQFFYNFSLVDLK